MQTVIVVLSVLVLFLLLIVIGTLSKITDMETVLIEHQIEWDKQMVEIKRHIAFIAQGERLEALQQANATLDKINHLIAKEEYEQVAKTKKILAELEAYLSVKI